MAVRPACPKCRTAVAFESQLAGKIVACPSCGHKFRMPSPQSKPPQPPNIPSEAPTPGVPQINIDPRPTPNRAAAPTTPSAAAPTPPSFRPLETPAAPVAGGVPATVPTRMQISRKPVESPWSLQPATSWLDIFDWRFRRYLTPWIVRFTWICVLILCGLLLAGMTLNNLGMRPSVNSFSVEDARRTSSDLAAVGRILLAVTPYISVAIFVLWVRVGLELMIVIFNIAHRVDNIGQTIEQRDD